jgi:general secretion pathway protein F
VASFRFEAADAGGRIEKGLVEAESPAAARAALRAKGLIPLEIGTLEAQAGRGLRRRFSEVELVGATRQLASLLSAGLPVAQALAATVDQAEDRAVREVFAAVRSDVFGGHPLAEALARFPRDFPAVYRASVAAGEESGELARVMEYLATHLEDRLAMRGKVLAAFLYPAIVTVVALAIVVFLMAYVVPQVVEVFRSSRQVLPWPTRVLLVTSDIVRYGGPWLLAAAVAGAFGVRAGGTGGFCACRSSAASCATWTRPASPRPWACWLEPACRSSPRWKPRAPRSPTRSCRPPSPT